MNNFTTVKKLHTKRIAVTVSIAAIIVACLLFCSACGYIFVSVSSITAEYNGNSVEVNGSIDESDVKVVAKYSNNTSKAVTDFKLSYDFASAGTKTVTVTYSEMGKSVKTTFDVEVKEKANGDKPEPPEPAVTLESITAIYNGESVLVGGVLNKEDIAVTAHYSDNSSKPVTDFTVSDFDSQTAGEKTVTVTYVEENVTKTTTVTIVVKDPPVTLQSITAEYTGQAITVGGTLNKSDIVVTANYSDDSGKTVTDFTLSELSSASAGDKTVTVTYIEGGVTQTCTVTVTVIEPEPAVTLESITAVYSGENIKVGGEPDHADITVIAHYSDGSSKTVTNFSVGGFSSAQAGVCTVTVSYVEDDVTKEATVNITVVDDSQEVIVNSNLSIHFLELGNQYTGDSVYIKAGDTDILIDAGSREGSAGTIGEYLDKYVTDNKLEYVIATHAHQDHIAGFVGTTSTVGILDKYECDTLIRYAQTKSTTQIRQKFETKCDEAVTRGTNLYTALDCVNNANGAQKIYDLTGDGSITMEVLDQRYYHEQSSDENDHSVCVLFRQKITETQTNNYLFTGDLEKEGEASLVELNPDLPQCVLFKGGHHGSYTASNEVLLSKIQPEYVCICCCAGNVEYTQNLDNTFPAQAMIDRIAKYTDKVYVTTLGKIKESTDKDGNFRWANDGYESMNGNITFGCVNGEITLNCSNNNLKLKETQWFKENRICPKEWLDEPE